MSAAARKLAALPSPLEVFIARAEAHAILYAACEFDLPEAVDRAQAVAERAGLVATLGQDAVQRILRDAFHAVRGGQ